MKKTFTRTFILAFIGFIAFNMFLYNKVDMVDSSNNSIAIGNMVDQPSVPVANIDINDVEVDTQSLDEKIDLLKDTTYETEDGKIIVKNTEDMLVLVNKRRNLPSDYKPKDLVVPKVSFSFKEDLEKRYLREEAALGLEELFEEAEKNNHILYAVSGYRSYNTQKGVFDRKEKSVGFEKANQLVAFPGQSEHQTGLAMDISSKSANLSLEEVFGQVPEGIWVKENAHKFGFIIRYPKEATEITGYSYEPWHIRYVGKEVATEIYEKNVTLEEFLVDK